MPEEKNWTFEEVEELYRQFNPNAVDGQDKVILIAEDSPPMRSVLASAFRKKGFEVIEADNGLTALKIIRDKTPDCCLLDIGMPHVSGLDILDAMKKDDKYANVPVLIVSARKEKKDIVMALRLGAVGYIVKPFSIDQVIRKTADAMGLG
jgi:DNA-binding response OmpR family regulator